MFSGLSPDSIEQGLGLSLNQPTLFGRVGVGRQPDRVQAPVRPLPRYLTGLPHLKYDSMSLKGTLLRMTVGLTAFLVGQQVSRGGTGLIARLVNLIPKGQRGLLSPLALTLSPQNYFTDVNNTFLQIVLDMRGQGGEIEPS